MNIIKINIISLLTIIYKESNRILRIWPQTIIPPIVTIILYLFIFGNLIGNKIGDINGFTYIEYIIPGLIMMSTITNAYTNVVSSFFGSKFQKNIEEILISPIKDSTIIFGFIFGGIFRSLIIFIFLLIIINYFSNINIYKKIILILSFLQTSIIFSLFGLLNGIIAQKFDDISIIPTFILTPMIYLSGIFYSIELLPNQLKFIVIINPIFYILNLFRYSFLGISNINIFNSIIVINILTLSLYLIISIILKKGYFLKK